MLSGLDRLAILAAMLGTMIVLYNQQQSLPREPERRPAPILPAPPAPARPPTPTPPQNPSLQDVTVPIREQPLPTGTYFRGTAFAVDSSGVWITARHVVNGCARASILGPFGTRNASVVFVHPQADIAVLLTVGGPRSFDRARAEPLVGDLAYSFGFPRDLPGAVEQSFIGRIRMEMTGGLKGIAPATIWAERKRWPDTDESLGGMSGGPTVDPRGRLLGVHVASWPRRGRTIAVAPEMVTQSLALAGAPRALNANWIPDMSINDDNAPNRLHDLRTTFSIAKFYCTV